jgi:putative DNA primase/helicase
MNAGALDATALRSALSGRAAELAINLLGDHNRGMSSKREMRFGRHGSLAVVITGPKAGMWHDHQSGAGGDMIALILRERGRGFRDAIVYAEQFVGQAPRQRASMVRTEAPDADVERNRRIALEIWGQAGTLAGTLARRYLDGRGIAELPSGVDGDVLRFHPACSYDGGRHPCMLALLRDIISNEPRAIQRTALTAEGSKLGRRTLGPKAGAAIKITDNSEVAERITIGEGLETTLAGVKLGYAPAWALGDAGEVAAFPILAGVESITILVDHDISGTGQRAAVRCSERWTRAGREVFRLLPRRPGADVNDLLTTGAPP